jgi:hypothetical protein
MPTNVRVIRAQDFIRAAPGGVLDLAASEKLLADIVLAAGSLDDYQVLLDTRNAIAVLETSDLYYLAERVAEHAGKLNHMTAVLCPLERFNHARFFTLCTQRRGLNIRPFATYEQAMEWLIENAAA